MQPLRVRYASTRALQFELRSPRVTSASTVDSPLLWSDGGSGNGLDRLVVAFKMDRAALHSFEGGKLLASDSGLDDRSEERWRSLEGRKSTRLGRRWGGGCGEWTGV